MGGIDLYSVHIDTLVDLYNIVRKHNCKLSIHTSNRSEIDFDRSWFDDMSEDVYEAFSDKVQTYSAQHTIETYTFKLLHLNENNEVISKSYMEYWEEDCYIYVDESDIDDIMSSYYLDNDEKDCEELNAWLEEHYNSDYSCISKRDCGTRFVGFDGVDTSHTVYREGIALKIFADAVCDLLNEPRIVGRTY